jgi:hypothetical protein
MDLQLSKEEFPIYHENCFKMPIYPKLLDPNLKIDGDLAHKVFPRVAEEWYEDLRSHTNTAELDYETRKWYEDVFLREKPNVKKDGPWQEVSKNLSWHDDVLLDENGFARGLSISRNGGGSLYYTEGDDCCRTPLMLNGNDRFARLSPEKAREFIVEDHGDIGYAHSYGHHNIDYFPGALFLRNWAVAYMNEALKEI